MIGLKEVLNQIIKTIFLKKYLQLLIINLK